MKTMTVTNRQKQNTAIEANKIKPVVDEKVFKLSELKEAYQYMWDQKHFGKLAIQIVQLRQGEVVQLLETLGNQIKKECTTRT